MFLLLFPLKFTLQTRVLMSIKLKGKTLDLVILEQKGTFYSICPDKHLGQLQVTSIYNLFSLNAEFFLFLRKEKKRNFVLRSWSSNFLRDLLATDCSYVLLEMLFIKFLCKGFRNLNYINALKYFLVKCKISILLLLHIKLEVSRLIELLHV